MEMKYIRHSQIGFVLWPRTDDLWHSHVAAAIPLKHGKKITSAGFCAVHEGTVTCWGRSESLDIDSHPDDAEMLARQLGIFPSTQGGAMYQANCAQKPLGFVSEDAIAGLGNPQLDWIPVWNRETGVNTVPVYTVLKPEQKERVIAPSVRRAAVLALDALISAQSSISGPYTVPKVKKAIEALREALAAHQPSPAHNASNDLNLSKALIDCGSHRSAWRDALAITQLCATTEADVSYWGHEIRAFNRTFDILTAPVQAALVECAYGNGGRACCEGGPCQADEAQNNAAQRPLTSDQRKAIEKANTVQGLQGDYYDAYGIMDDVEFFHGIKKG